MCTFGQCPVPIKGHPNIDSSSFYYYYYYYYTYTFYCGCITQLQFSYVYAFTTLRFKSCHMHLQLVIGIVLLGYLLLILVTNKWCNSSIFVNPACWVASWVTPSLVGDHLGWL